MNDLITKRLIIRKFTKKDALNAHSLFCDEDAMRFLALFPAFTSIDQTKERIQEWMNDNEHFALENKENGEFIGYIAINPDSEEDREDTRELAFCILKEERQKGYAFEAVQAILNELKSEGIKYVWACSFEGNDASKRLIEKLKFELQNIGTFEVENDKEYISYEYRIELN